MRSARQTEKASPCHQSGHQPLAQNPPAKKKKKKEEGVPTAAQQVKNPSSIHDHTGLTPGLAQWVKDQALLQAVAQAVDAAQIWHCSGCAVGWQLQL